MNQRATSQNSKPPRAIQPRDVVVTYSVDLGEWTAAQIVALYPKSKTVDVQELDWSGNEPDTLKDLGPLVPLRTQDAHYERDWVLPRSHRVIGRADDLLAKPSHNFRVGWYTGRALHEHRLNADGRVLVDDGSICRLGERHLQELLQDPNFTNPHIHDLTLVPGPISGPLVDCARLSRAFPKVTRLTVWGVAGKLQHADALNELELLQTLELEDVFGMTAADVLDPGRLCQLERVDLTSVPADYAAAMRRTWSPEIPKGVFLSIVQPRRPEWVAVNQANPLRSWNGRASISRKAYARAKAAWGEAVALLVRSLDLEAPPSEWTDGLESCGRQIARIFSEANKPEHFIETDERDELLDAVSTLIHETPLTREGCDRELAAHVVLRAINEERTW